MSQQDSNYSCEQQYFLDVCRGGDISQLKQFLQTFDDSNFNWKWFSNSQDNFIHMLAANNLTQMFQYLYPILKLKCSDFLPQILNKQNSSANTPLRILQNNQDYAVITDSKEMISKLIQAGVNPHINNEHGRTPFQEAQKFGKFEIAQILAPVTKMDAQKIQRLVSDMKLDDDSSSSDEDEQKRQQNQQIMEQKKNEIQGLEKKQEIMLTSEEIKQQKQIQKIQEQKI